MIKLETFNDYVYETTKLILDNVIANKISLTDAAGIFYFVEKSKDLENLKRILQTLKKDYPAIEEIFEMEQSGTKLSTEELVSRFISFIIKDNPLLASEISKEACKKESSLESLKIKYPSFSDYLSKL